MAASTQDLLGHGISTNRIVDYFPKVITRSCSHSDHTLLVTKNLLIALKVNCSKNDRVHNYIIDLQGCKRGMLFSNNLLLLVINLPFLSISITIIRTTELCFRL